MNTGKNELTVSPEALLKRIHAEFTELSWHDFTFLDHGWDHAVIILDGSLVFRFPDDDEYLGFFKHEADLLDFIATKTDTRIPRYTYMAQDFSFGGYELITGKELSLELYESLSADKHARIVSQLAAFITNMHTIPLNELAAFKLTYQNYLDDYNALVTGTTQHLTPLLNKSEMDFIETLLAKIEQINAQKLPQQLIHNDLSDAHILWEGNSHKIGVIDFSDRVIGDPALDFSGLFVYGEDFVKSVYRQYGGPKDEGFLPRAKTYAQRAAVYLLLDSFESDKISYQKAKVMFDVARLL